VPLLVARARLVGRDTPGKESAEETGEVEV
jgi:hypothetical protein